MLTRIAFIASDAGPVDEAMGAIDLTDSHVCQCMHGFVFHSSLNPFQSVDVIVVQNGITFPVGNPVVQAFTRAGVDLRLQPDRICGDIYITDAVSCVYSYRMMHAFNSPLS
jgi:hypothetical protein